MVVLPEQDADGGRAIGDRDPAHAAQGGGAEVNQSHRCRERNQEYGRDVMNSENAHAAGRMSVGDGVDNWEPSFGALRRLWFTAERRWGAGDYLRNVGEYFAAGAGRSIDDRSASR